VAHAVVFLILNHLFNIETTFTVASFDSNQPLVITLPAKKQPTVASDTKRDNLVKPLKMPVARPNHSASSLPLLSDSQKFAESVNNSTQTLAISNFNFDRSNTSTSNLLQGTSAQQEADTDQATQPDHSDKLENPAVGQTLEQKIAIIHKKLNALVEKNFRYPRFAVKRGWQGTVELGLRIEPDGKLSHVRIIKTSGYGILDNAALNTLTEASTINGLETWLAGNYFDTTLPVKYQLIGG